MTAETKPPPTPDPEEPPKTSRTPWWGGAIAALALTVGIVGGILFYGYQARPGWVGVSDKKFWDFLELLIVPAALALGVWWLNRMQERERQAQQAHREHERKAEAEQRERERVAIEEARREREREAQAAQKERELEIENQRAQDAALQAYLDQMSHLLTDKDRPLHRAQLGDSLSTVVRARTLTILPRLDGVRKGSILEFLYECSLISGDHHILDLQHADLNGARLVDWAVLSFVNLQFVSLRFVRLRQADLREADLTGADLRTADLIGADLRGAKLALADLNGANLRNAFLPSADLSLAKLVGTDLRGAFLKGVEGVDNDDLQQLVHQPESLEGAIMPDGQKFEDWFQAKSGHSYESWIKYDYEGSWMEDLDRKLVKEVLGDLYKDYEIRREEGENIGRPSW